MATIGMRYPIIAVCTEDEETGTVTYSQARVLGGAISARVNVTISDTPLYADDRKKESLREFTGGTVELNVDDLDMEARAQVFGQTIKEVTTGQGETATTHKELLANADDQSPYLGQGFFAPRIRDGKRKYRALWFRKVQYGAPNEESDTKGETVAWKTPTISGSLMADINGAWKDEALFDKAEDAKQWLNDKAGGITKGEEAQP